MRKLIIAAALAIGLFSCLDKDGDNTTFNQQDFAGKYKLDLTELAKSIKESGDSTTSEKLANAAFMGAVSQFNMEFNFYPSGKGLLTLDMGIFEAFSDEPRDPVEFDYRIENDTVLYITEKGDENNMGFDTLYIQKFAGAYDVINVIQPGKPEEKLRLIRQE